MTVVAVAAEEEHNEALALVFISHVANKGV